jgi:hypothetical protein
MPAQTGIIATAATPGPAVDVCAVNDVSSSPTRVGVSVHRLNG